MMKFARGVAWHAFYCAYYFTICPKYFLRIDLPIAHEGFDISLNDISGIVIISNQYFLVINIDF